MQRVPPETPQGKCIAAELLANTTEELVKKANEFTLDSEHKLSATFSKAMTYKSIEEKSEDRHSNPFMKFLEKFYNAITFGFGHVLPIPNQL
jgi:pantothenate kinase-related protein Tda10